MTKNAKVFTYVQLNWVHRMSQIQNPHTEGGAATTRRTGRERRLNHIVNQPSPRLIYLGYELCTPQLIIIVRPQLIATVDVAALSRAVVSS